MSNWEKRELLNLFGVIFMVTVVPAVVAALVTGSWIPIFALALMTGLFSGLIGLFKFWSWVGEKIFPD